VKALNNRLFLEKMAGSMLNKLFKCLDAKEYTIEKRDKNRAFLAMNGFTLEDQLAILRSLTPADCIKAEPDRDDPDGNDEYWFHKKGYGDLMVYVKYKIILKIRPGSELEHAFIKSLHEDGF